MKQFIEARVILSYLYDTVPSMAMLIGEYLTVQVLMGSSNNNNIVYYDDRTEKFVLIELKFVPNWLMTWCGGWVMLPENVAAFKTGNYPLINPVSSDTYVVKSPHLSIWCTFVFTMNSVIYMIGINRNSPKKLYVYKLVELEWVHVADFSTFYSHDMIAVVFGSVAYFVSDGSGKVEVHQFADTKVKLVLTLDQYYYKSAFRCYHELIITGPISIAFNPQTLTKRVVNELHCRHMGLNVNDEVYLVTRDNPDVITLASYNHGTIRELDASLKNYFVGELPITMLI